MSRRAKPGSPTVRMTAGSTSLGLLPRTPRVYDLGEDSQTELLAGVVAVHGGYGWEEGGDGAHGDGGGDREVAD